MLVGRKKGFKHSIETKQRLKEAKLKNPTKYWLGKKRPEMIGNKNALGKKHTEIWKKQNSERMLGNKNGFKKGHKIRFKKGCLKYNNKQVLKRDDYTCKICSMRDVEIMQVDHIVEKALGGNDLLINLQTLCPNCHARKTKRFMKMRLTK